MFKVSLGGLCSSMKFPSCYYLLFNWNKTYKILSKIFHVFQLNYHCIFVQNPLHNALCDVMMLQIHHRLLCDFMNAILSNRCSLPRVTPLAAIKHQQFQKKIFWDCNKTVEINQHMSSAVYKPNFITIFQSVFQQQSQAIRHAPYGIGHLAVWYKTKFGCQNFGYQIWCFGGVFLWYICFDKCVQYESNNIVIKYYGSVIPHDWYMIFEQFGGLPPVVAAYEN